MKVRIKGGGDVNLTKRNFLASGGEGEVYVHNGMAFKIYSDPSKMIPEAKIQELAGIKDPKVIKPLDIILKRNKPVGYTMSYLHNTYSLCQLFPKAFKQRNNLTPKKVLKLVQGMQESVRNIHNGGVLIVDANEMNFLVDENFKGVFFIDVDSYQTSNFPATALMDSVKDWKANGKWSNGSDWFSWGIVSFQMFMGIHPFKGKHPSVKGLIHRMQQGISVFNGDVSVPKMVPSLDAIPQVYRDWYRAVFEDGKRVEPPFETCAVIQVKTLKPISSSTHLDIVEIFDHHTFSEDVVKFAQMNGLSVIVTNDQIEWTRGMSFRKRPMDGKIHLGVGGSKSEPFYGCCKVSVQSFSRDWDAKFYFLEDGEEIYSDLRCQSMMSYDGRVYIKSGEQILEVEPLYMGKKRIMGSRVVANVMENATRLFEGVAIQDMLGSWYATVFPEAGKSYQGRLEELDGYKVIEAKYDSRVLMVIGSKGGRYDKFVYRFDRFGSVADVKPELFWIDKDIVYSGINFVTLANGVCAHIDENEDLILFSTSIGTIKKISDSVLSNDMKLCKRGIEVLFMQGKRMYKLSTKKE
jgi:hypothetical protein